MSQSKWSEVLWGIVSIIHVGYLNMTWNLKSPSNVYMCIIHAEVLQTSHHYFTSELRLKI